LAIIIHLDPRGNGKNRGEKMQTPLIKMKTEIQRAYLEWDRTYAYDQLGFNPKLF
jgi:hypothetical protein